MHKTCRDPAQIPYNFGEWQEPACRSLLVVVVRIVLGQNYWEGANEPNQTKPNQG
jgi:hypothetical protein